MGQISTFFTWREYFAPELYACGSKSFPTKIFTHFGRPTVENYDSVFFIGVGPDLRSVILRCDQIGQISKFFIWREYFGPELDASGPESFPPGFYTYFGRPTAKNYDSVFLTCLRPELMFGPFEVRWVKFLKFWPGETSDLYDSGAESFPPRFFTHFGCPTARKLQFGFFNRCATKWCFWPACDQNLYLVLSRWAPGKIFKILTWRDFGPLRQWRQKFPFRIFHSFWLPYHRKLRFGHFDH